MYKQKALVYVVRAQATKMLLKNQICYYEALLIVILRDISLAASKNSFGKAYVDR